jgi:hypothetical protein
MASTYSQLPGPLHLSLRRGDEFGTSIDFDIDMTGYTVSSSIVSAITGSAVGTMTATLTNAQTGVVNVSMTEEQTAAIVPGTYSWRLEWTAPGSVKRTALTGFVEVAK